MNNSNVCVQFLDDRSKHGVDVGQVGSVCSPVRKPKSLRGILDTNSASNIIRKDFIVCIHIKQCQHHQSSGG